MKIKLELGTVFCASVIWHIYTSDFVLLMDKIAFWLADSCFVSHGSQILFLGDSSVNRCVFLVYFCCYRTVLIPFIYCYMAKGIPLIPANNVMHVDYFPSGVDFCILCKVNS